MVTDYMIEYISTTNLKCSLKVRSLFIFLPHLIPLPSYNRSKNFLHRRLHSKILESPNQRHHFYFVTSFQIRPIPTLIISCKLYNIAAINQACYKLSQCICTVQCWLLSRLVARATDSLVRQVLHLPAWQLCPWAAATNCCNKATE